MRKLIWCGVALCAFGVVGAYYAARYTAKHPDCFLARCANLASYVGARCSPLLALMPAEKRQPKVAAVPCNLEDAIDEAIAGLCRGIDPSKEPVEPIIVEPIDPGIRPEAVPTPDTSEPDRLEITDPKVPVMPYAETPSAASPSQALVNACWNWLAERMTPCSSEQEVCPASCFVQMHIRPFRELMKVLHEETATDIQKQIESNDRPELSVLPPDLPLLHPELPFFPQLQVDPHHHHHYPSCPYTGRCPAPQTNGRMVPSLDTPRDVPTSPVPRNEVNSEDSSASRPAKKWLFSFFLGTIR